MTEHLDDRMDTIETEFLSLSDRVKGLEDRVGVNTSILKDSRENQRRSEIALYCLFGFLIVIALGIKYQDGSISFGIPAEIIACIAAGTPVLIKVWTSRSEESSDKKKLGGGSDRE